MARVTGRVQASVDQFRPVSVGWFHQLSSRRLFTVITIVFQFDSPSADLVRLFSLCDWPRWSLRLRLVFVRRFPVSDVHAQVHSELTQELLEPS